MRERVNKWERERVGMSKSVTGWGWGWVGLGAAKSPSNDVFPKLVPIRGCPQRCCEVGPIGVEGGRRWCVLMCPISSLPAPVYDYHYVLLSLSSLYLVKIIIHYLYHPFYYLTRGYC